MRDIFSSSEEVSSGYFLDLIAFWYAVSTYVQIKGEEDAHAESAYKLMLRYRIPFTEGIGHYLSPLTESDSALLRFRSPLRVLSLPRHGIEHVHEQARIISEIFQVLKTRPAILKSTFGDEPRSFASARRMILVDLTEDPEVTLAKLISVPPASKLQLTREWIKRAVRYANVDVSSIETVLGDSDLASALGEDLRKVDIELSSVDPNSIESMVLEEKRQEILEDIENVVSQSDFPEVALSSAALSAKPREFLTSVGKAQALSPAQEQAMVVRGKSIIAAGAGSGKTRVLASKVVYHMTELGVPAMSMMATSFSRKSAAELEKRIKDSGGVFPPGTDGGLGTTHSVAGKLIRDYTGKVFSAKNDSLSTADTSNIFRLAMEQVQMVSPQGWDVPEATSFFEYNADIKKRDTPEQPRDGITFRQALERAHAKRRQLSGFLDEFIDGFFNIRSPYHKGNTLKTENLTNIYGLTDKQLGILKQIFDRTGVDYNPNRDPLFVGHQKTSAKDKDKGLRDMFNSFSKPLNQWFNLGLVLTEDGTAESKPLAKSHFQRAVTKLKGSCISPTEAWHLASEGKGIDGIGQAEAAVYAAYEYLKGPGGEAWFQGKGDNDDVLIEASRMMVANPKIRKQIQDRFKVVLVDEAQDLNRAQHLMFGLIAGFVDPEKASNIAYVDQFAEIAKEDGSMTADTYCFIGDDKQAIFGFRGADPESFIDMSDLVEGGAGFSTKILNTNYRSGKNIVEAANRLISHNNKQIPMECNANPSRPSQGGIMRIPFAPVEANDMTEPAKWVAERVQDIMESGQAHNGYDSFGVGLRSNAEAYDYGLELLKLGIPFRSSVNFFSDYNVKSLLGWLTLVDQGVYGDEKLINDVVLNATGAPASMLGKKFRDDLPKYATGNYLVWLSTGDNYKKIYGAFGDYTARVKAYVDNMLEVASWKDANLDSNVVMTRLLALKGANGLTLQESLVERVRDDEERLAELRANDPNGEITEDSLREEALAPLRPLMGLLGARPNVSEALKYVRILEETNSKITSTDVLSKTPAVTLGTMHSWKGLEVQNMFVPVVGGKFPRTDATDDDLASERRLGYVALTRGEENVFVLDIPTVRETKTGPLVLQSRFVDEMCIPPQEYKSVQASYKGRSALLNRVASAYAKRKALG